MKKIVIVLISFLIFSCSNRNIKTENLDKEKTKENNLINDTSLLVSENSVIFLIPDGKEFKKMQNEIPEDEYNEIIADMMWYPGVAGEILDSLKIKNVQCDKKYILLQGINNSITVIERQKIKGNMIVFNIEKEPWISYAISFDKDSTINFLFK